MATIGPKLYFHDATTTNTGTLPGSSTQSSVTANVTATGASTNRTLNDTIGTGQVSVALTTLAQTTSQNNWFRRFMTPPLAAQTISATWAGGMGLAGGASSESNTNSNFNAPRMLQVIYTWRPSTGAVVTTILDHSFSAYALGGTGATAETWGFGNSAGSQGGFTGTASTIQDGDILVVEVWSPWNQAQSKATAYTNTWWYDGTTEDSSTNAASYFSVPAALTLYTAPPPSPPKMLQVGNVAVQRASQW